MLGRRAYSGFGQKRQGCCVYFAGCPGGRVKSVTIAAGEKNDAALEFAARCETLGAHVVFDMYTFKDTYDVCIVSPGISQFSRFYENAKAASTEVISEVEFAWRESPADSRWVAVTGTNGKTTTTSLITHIFGCAGERVAAVGNIGNTCIEVVERRGRRVCVRGELVPAGELPGVCARGRPRCSTSRPTICIGT